MFGGGRGSWMGRQAGQPVLTRGVLPAPVIDSRHAPYPPLQNAQPRKKLLRKLWELPFHVKERSAIEQHTRRGRPFVDDLLKVQQHWVSTEIGKLWNKPPAQITVQTSLNTSSDSEPPPATTTTPNGHVEIRAFFASGINEDRSLHVLRRIKCLACNNNGIISAFGGTYPDENPTVEDEQKFLSEKVKEQTGLCIDEANWERLCSLEKRNGKRTTYYIPTTGFEGPIAITGNNSSAGLPVTCTLIDLLDATVTPHPDSHNMLELLMAADSFDEYLARDMISKAYSFLQENAKSKSAFDHQIASHRAAHQDASQRHQREIENHKVEIAKKKEGLLTNWEQEDEGRTDRQKKSLEEERRSEFSKLEESVPEEPKPDTKEQLIYKVKMIEDHNAVMAFQYFDRPRGVSESDGICRSYFSSLLLCLGLPELSTIGQVESFLDSCIPLGDYIPYTTLCTIISPC